MPHGLVVRLLAFVFLLAAAPLVRAQYDPAAQLRKEQAQQLRDEARRGLDVPPPIQAVPLYADPKDIPETGPTLTAPKLNIDRNGLLNEAAVDRLLATYRPLPLGDARIQLLLRQLNVLLVEAGLVTSRARLTRIDRQGNAIDIALVPGHLEGVVRDGRPLDPALRRAFPAQDGAPLVLADVEQGIHQIQRLRLYQAEARILPGQTASASRVDLNLSATKPWWFQAALDNQGTAALGTLRGRATLALEDILGLLESTGLTYVQSERSAAALASLNLPHGYDTWSLTYAASRYRQHLPAGLEQTGGSHTASLAWNRVLHLAAEGRSAFDLSLTYGDGWRKINEVPLASERLAVLRAALNSLRQGKGWRAWGEAGLSRGVPWFGAKDDPAGLTAAAAHAEFTKLDLHGGVIAVLPGNSVTYTGQVDAQAARTGLYSQEQFRLGGMSSVRGYDEGVVAGDDGFVLRHELGGRPWPGDGPLKASPVLFLDHGRVRLSGVRPVRLVGAGAGLRLGSGPVSGELFVARPVDHDSSLSTRQWHLHAVLRIDL